MHASFQTQSVGKPPFLRLFCRCAWPITLTAAALLPASLFASLPKTRNSGSQYPAVVTNATPRIQKPISRIAKPESNQEPGTKNQEPGTKNQDPSWTPQPLSRYQGIIDRMPFGKPPPPPPPAPQPAAPPAPPPPPFVSTLTLCAINRTPKGGVYVGFVDGSQNPPRNYYMERGEDRDGFTVVSADFEREMATIEKEGVKVDLQMKGTRVAGVAAPLSASPMPAPVSVAPPDGAASAAPVADPVRLGRIQRPSQAGMPPMPGIAPAKLAEMQKTREELAKLRESGGDVKSYLVRLRERKAREAEEKAAAEQAARDKIQELATQATEAEVKKREREINLNLIELGARPVSDITLTSEEEKTLVDKGVLP